MAFRFINGASVAALTVLNATIVPSARTVYRLRTEESLSATPVGVVHTPPGPAPGAQAIHRRVPSEANLYPDNCVMSATGL